MQTTAAAVTAVYGALVLLGGIMGWVKARSKPSLIMGTVFGIVLIALGLGGIWGRFVAPAAAGLAGFLLLFFGARYLRKKKFMPAGLIAFLSAVALCLDLLALAVRS